MNYIVENFSNFEICLQSIWISVRGAQRQLDEAKLRFAAAEVLFI